jgi:chemotaxis methyl-accepting protein methylase
MRASGDVHRGVSFDVGDIAHLPASRYAAILCRGVLMTFSTTPVETRLRGLRRALQPNGALILDVRNGLPRWNGMGQGTAVPETSLYGARRIDLHKRHRGSTIKTGNC